MINEVYSFISGIKRKTKKRKKGRLKTTIRYYGMGKNFRVEKGKNYTNGEVRMRIYDGDGKGIFKWVFAGNTHEIFQEGILRDAAGMRLGNFDSIIQATRRNKYERLKRVRNSLIGE